MTDDTLAHIQAHLEGLSGEEFQAFATQMARSLAKTGYPALTKLELLLTEHCNLRCDYCWIPKRPAYMSWDVARQAIDYLMKESGSSDSVEITLFGGEPLLAWGLLTRCVRYATSAGRREGKTVNWAITTNGLLLDERKARFAAEYGISYLLSIDGHESVHDRHRRTIDGRGSYRAVIGKIPLLKQYQGWIGSRMTLTPDTVGQLTDSVRVLARMGVNQFLVGIDSTGLWDKAATELLYQQWLSLAELYIKLRRVGWPIRLLSFESPLGDFGKEKQVPGWGCEGGQDKIAVTPSGDLYPCARYVDRDWLRQATWLGHVSTGITAERTRLAVVDPREIVRVKCMPCRRKRTCAGGCPATNWLATGSPFAADPFHCRLVRISSMLRRAVPEAYQVSDLPYDSGVGGWQGYPAPLRCLHPLN